MNFCFQYPIMIIRSIDANLDLCKIPCRISTLGIEFQGGTLMKDQTPPTMHGQKTMKRNLFQRSYGDDY